MDYLLALLALLVGLLAGYLWARTRAQAEQARLLADAQRTREELAARAAELDATRGALEERASFLEQSRKQLEDAFGNLARKALQDNSDSFLRQASDRFATLRGETRAELEQRKQAIELLLKPMADTLGKLESRAQEMERVREKAYGELRQQLHALSETTQGLQSTSQALATALRGSSQARGRWGEMALRNIAELAGMTAHCDFVEQGTEGDLRPDMIVRLPRGAGIPIDAKVPLSGYLEALEAQEPAERRRLLQKHARELRAHVTALEKREYHAHRGIAGAIDFTVLFLPGEPFLAAAFEADPAIQDYAMSRRILIATPVTLVALLRTVGLYWKHEAIAQDTQKVWDAAREYYRRGTVFQEHLASLGRGLQQAVASYNKAVGSFERKLLPQGRRLEELQVVDGHRKLQPLQPVDAAPRDLESRASGPGSAQAAEPREREAEAP